MSERFTYLTVKAYTLDDEDERELLEEQNECTFMWSNKEGWPVGVIMSYIFYDGCFWLSVSTDRVRVKAVERDPRVAISITSTGSRIKHSLALTYKGTCEVLKDRETIEWFFPLLAKRLRWGDEVEQKEFVRLNDTPERRVMKVTPTQRIGFDARKMAAATAAARAAGTI